MSEPRTPRKTTPRGHAQPVRPESVTLDARSLRGLAHPMRVRLLGLLRQHGPATASGLAARVGESSGVTSYHLRQLAAYGFVVEDETPRANRRERWWRSAHRATVLEPLPEPDEETRALVDEYLRSVAGGHAERVLRWSEGAAARREALGEAWADTGDLSDWWLDLTPSEAVRLDRELHAVLDRYRRADIAVPPSRRRERVVVQLQVMPTPTAPLAEDDAS